MAKKPAATGTQTVNAAAHNTPAAPAEPQMSKMDAVRKALEEDATLKGQDGAEYIKAKFGLDVTAQTFSQYSSTIRKKEGGSPVVRTRANSSGPKAIDREAIRTANELYKRFGEDMLEEILSALRTYGEDGLREAFEVVKMFHEDEEAISNK